MADLANGLIGLGMLTGTNAVADFAASAATVETRAQRKARAQFVTPATTPPWKAAAKTPPVQSQVAAIKAMTTIIDRNGTGTSGPLPDDVQTSFTTYKALDRLRLLAETAAKTTTGSTERTALQTAFAKGLGDLQAYLGSAPSRLVDLSFGATARQAQSIAVAPPSSLTATTITGKGVVDTRTSVIPGVTGAETLRIDLSTATAADSLIVDLGGETTLDGIADRINTAIAAVPRRDATGAVVVAADGAPVPRWEVRIVPAKTGDRWGLSIERGGFETVAIDQPGAGDALMIARGLGDAGVSSAGAGPGASGAAGAGDSLAFGRIDDPAGAMTRRTFATLGAVDRPATERLKIAADADKTGKTKATSLSAAIDAAAMVTDAQGFGYVVGTVAGDIGANRIRGATDLALTKLDSEGAILWTRTLGAAGDARGAAVTLAPDGSIVVAGTVTGGFDGATSDGDLLVARFDAQGDEQFSSLIRAPGLQRASAVAVAADGAIFVGGRTDAAGSAATIVHLDSSGRTVGQRRFDGVDSNSAGSGDRGSDGVRSLAVAADGTLLALTSEAGHAVVRRLGAGGVTTDLGRLDLGRGDARALAVADDGAIAVVGATDTALGGTQVNARGTGRDGFVARVDAALSGAGVTYLATGGEDQADSVAWLGGDIHVGGRTAGALGGARTGAVDAFVARVDGATGVIDTVAQFGTAGVTAKAVQVAVAKGGDSILGALGLHRGTVTPTDSAALEAQTSLRAGDMFAIRVNGGAPARIVIAEGDTITTLADRVRHLVGSRVGSVTTPSSSAGRSLRIDMKPGNMIELVAGPGGRDALPRLGLEARRIAAPSVTDPGAPRVTPGGRFGLDLSRTLRISDKRDAAAALARITQAISFTQSAYRSLYWDDTKALLADTPARSGQKGGSTAIARAQTANYQAALTRLSGTSATSSFGF